jgi:hypothetical protein
MRQNKAPERYGFRCVLCTLGPSCILAYTEILLKLSQGGTNYNKFDIILYTINYNFIFFLHHTTSNTVFVRVV